MIQYSNSYSAFNVSWGYKIDPIYRILSKKEYLDDFFENGNLFISNFGNFKSYDDEMKGDISEGTSMIGGFDKEGNGNHILRRRSTGIYIMHNKSFN